MKLYYFKAPHGNFGDDLNEWLWPRLLGPNFFDDDASRIFVGVGTLLNHRIPAATKTIVFGAGHGYGSKPNIDGSWQFLCVRGPKTAEALGLSPDCAITDPAILIYPYTRDFVRPVKGRVGFMPHCDSAEFGHWDVVAAQAGLHYIDSRWTVDRVIAEIGSCERLLTEAMHGAIFADAMRVPWVPLVAYPHISTFKWQDWCESLEMQYVPNEIPSLWRGDGDLPATARFKNRLKRALKKIGIWRVTWGDATPRKSSRKEEYELVACLARHARNLPVQLSEDRVHQDRLAQLQSKIEVLKTLR